MSRPTKARGPRRPRPADVPGVEVRRVALDALGRIEEGGGYANLVVATVLGEPAGAALEDRDRHFVTDLVYGTTRMRRACDHLVERHRTGDVSARVGAALRLGAYQLAFAGVAPHAAVSATVGAAPKSARGLVNAVLRRVADDVEAGITWPDAGTEHSVPDWIVATLRHRLGDETAQGALVAMNLPATTHVRDDGYVQDLASQAVVDAVDAGPGMRVLDTCAAPGGKATGLAARGALVVAGDPAPHRARLIASNRDRLATLPGPDAPPLQIVVADGTACPFPAATFDRVLVDAPCTGLGVLRRRPDARWRIDGQAPDRLAGLQVDLLLEGAAQVAPGGVLVYSVCTLTVEENGEVVDRVTPRLAESGFELVDTTTMVPDATTDGMFVARWRRRTSATWPTTEN